MDELKLKGRYEFLKKEIERHNRLYFDQADPEISDFDFDSLMEELLQIERQFPSWIASDSPSQKVGERHLRSTTAKHIRPMISLDKVFDVESLEKFTTKIFSENPHAPIHAELKMDGCAVAIHYRYGKLARALTRGNGVEGDDITDKLRLLLPVFIEQWKEAELIELRAEIYLPFTAFERFNEEKRKSGEKVFANPRNAAAGALKLLDLQKFQERGLEVAVYQIAHDSRKEIDSLTKSWSQLRSLHLVKDPWHKVCYSNSDVLDAVAKAEAIRPSLPFGIDGVVFKVDSYHLQEEMGSTGQYYRWAVAYKFTPQKAITQLRNVEFQVGRTGVITPVANLVPVLLDGSCVKRASLYNGEEIERLDLREGDWVELQKSGDIIPKLIRVLAHKREKEREVWKLPVTCPSCSSVLIKEEGTVALRCVSSDCPEQVQRGLIYFCSKEAFDIEGLGEKSLRLLYSLGIISGIRDIFSLKAEQIESCEGFGKLSASQLIAAIREKSHIPYARLILSLGLPGVGAGLAKILARETESVWDLVRITKERLLAIDGMGPITATQLLEAFAPILAHLEGDLFSLAISPDEKVDFTQRCLLEILSLVQQKVLTVQYPKRLDPSQKRTLEGKSVVITGQFSRFSRKELTERAEMLGARVNSSVSKNTSYLFAGEKAGSKLAKATSLGVKTLDEEATLVLLDLMD